VLTTITCIDVVTSLLRHRAYSLPREVSADHTALRHSIGTRP
jgi:hypothetical protein